MSGCPKAGMRFQTEIGEGGSRKRAVGYMSTVGAALTQPELGRMKPKLTNPESPDFSRGECQISLFVAFYSLLIQFYVGPKVLYRVKESRAIFFLSTILALTFIEMFVIGTTVGIG
ncbi:MAG: hypothetical protein ACTSYT_00930 [Candidatus Asgardarchaeia archaeon]